MTLVFAIVSAAISAGVSYFAAQHRASKPRELEDCLIDLVNGQVRVQLGDGRSRQTWAVDPRMAHYLSDHLLTCAARAARRDERELDA